MVHFVARWRVFTLPAVAILALLGLYGASRVEEGFEIKDFFSSDTDLVKGLDKNELYFGPGGGDLDYVYVEGDLTAPDTLVAIEATEATISESDALLVRDFNGDVEFSPNAATVVRLATSSAIMRDAIAAQSGVEITDDDGDGLADTAEQVAAIYEYVRTEAIDDDDGVEVFTPDRTETFLFVGDSVQATRVAFSASPRSPTRRSSRWCRSCWWSRGSTGSCSSSATR